MPENRPLRDRLGDAVWAARQGEGVRGARARLEAQLASLEARLAESERRNHEAQHGSDDLRQAFDDLAEKHHIVVTDLERIVNGDGGAFATLVPPGHFYSALPSMRDIDEDADRIFAERDETQIPGVAFRLEEQLGLLNVLGPLVAPLGIPREATEGWRFHGLNESYEMADALVLAGMLLHIRPSRVVEVGSGYSSALMLDLRDRALPDLDLTFIEPFPDLLDTLTSEADHETTVRLDARVQDVPVDTFAGLGSGDVLLIDSTHVAKIGSDVNHLFLDVLPTLAAGVWVHVHDVFWPFEYPERWVREGRSWNEQYLLRALLQDSDRWEIQFFTDLLLSRHRADFVEAFPDAAPYFGGSFWMRRR